MYTPLASVIFFLALASFGIFSEPNMQLDPKLHRRRKKKKVVETSHDAINAILYMKKVLEDYLAHWYKDNNYA